jgi:hypothetical protein
VQGDGKLIVSGLFTAFDGRVRGRIARLHANGGLDEMFDPGIGANDWIVAVPIQADGMILAGGYFTNFNGVEHNRLVRLKP